MDGRENIEPVDSLRGHDRHTGPAMRALVLIGACLAGIALVLGFTAFAGGSGSGKAAKPTLRIVHSKPAKVRGEHFGAGEAVRVTAEKRTLGTKANGDGTFVVTIPGASRCDSTRVLARGSAGSYAIVKLLPSPECLPARTS
jgi:hypothetical protein